MKVSKRIRKFLIQLKVKEENSKIYDLEKVEEFTETDGKKAKNSKEFKFAITIPISRFSLFAGQSGIPSISLDLTKN